MKVFCFLPCLGGAILAVLLYEAAYTVSARFAGLDAQPNMNLLAQMLMWRYPEVGLKRGNVLWAFITAAFSLVVFVPAWLLMRCSRIKTSTLAWFCFGWAVGLLLAAHLVLVFLFVTV